MNAQKALHEAYEEWRRLAEAEGEAIRAGNWDLVSDCQIALQDLQPRILRCTEQAQEEWTRLGLDPSAMEDEFRRVIKSLIDLENRNQVSLNTQRSAAQDEFKELTEVNRTLQRVKRSYAQIQTSTWTTIS